MVTDEQIRRLFMLVSKEPTKALAAAKAGMTPKTALKYRKGGQLPSQMKQSHDWRTRPDPFVDKWPWVVELFKTNPGLESKTVFDYLQRENPGQYQDGQLRTLQRRIGVCDFNIDDRSLSPADKHILLDDRGRQRLLVA